MVALASPNVVWWPTPDPSVVKQLWIEVKKASTGDTIDVASQNITPRLGMFVGSTAAVRAPVTIVGTVLTLPAGLTNDSGYIVVLGT